MITKINFRVITDLIYALQSAFDYFMILSLYKIYYNCYKVHDSFLIKHFTVTLCLPSEQMKLHYVCTAVNCGNGAMDRAKHSFTKHKASWPDDACRSVVDVSVALKQALAIFPFRICIKYMHIFI